MFEPVKCPPGCKYAMIAKHNKDGSVDEHCGYVIYMDQLRGCDPGPDCIRYEPGARIADSRFRPKQRGPKCGWDERKGFAMWQSGKTDREIADELGISRKLVSATRRRRWQKEAKNESNF